MPPQMHSIVIFRWNFFFSPIFYFFFLEFPIVCHGIRKRCSDTSFKRFLRWLMAQPICLLRVQCFCSTYRCACIIVLFLICFVITFENWMVQITFNIQQISFLRSFNSIFRWKGECRIETDKEAKKFSANIMWVESISRWFQESADVYAPFVLIQLVFSMIFSACVLVFLDMVFIANNSNRINPIYYN